MTRVLIVEDEASIALGLRDDLEFEGYDVRVVTNGEEALRQGREEPFDVILLDLMLPGLDGFQVCRELRRAGVGTPIIMLTARSHEAEKVMGLELGADDYVTKPFSPSELRARIRSVLRRTASDTPPLHRFGDIEADFQRFELRRAGKPIRVTPLELKLLAAFVRHPGRALSRVFIKDEVWGRDAFMTDRVIDTHIANLRKKIEPDASEPRYLVSVRGVGYRFDA